MNSSPVIVLDNGASTIKCGTTQVEGRQPSLVPNAIARSKGDKMTYFGHEIANCKDRASLHYRLPFEKGYLVDWDAQKAIWDGVFSDVLNINTMESSLLITEPYFNLPNIQDIYDQFVFEEYDFLSYCRCTPASLVPHGNLFIADGRSPPECILIVDSGFSFTHVVPLISGSIIWNAVKRIDVGGKLLTNQLKEMTSYRQWNMMDETYIINHVKESCCYVSTDFDKDLKSCRSNSRHNPIIKEYILPDFSFNRDGRLRLPQEKIEDSWQVMHMNNERFTVPEILFTPSDVGMEQAGLPEVIAHSISLLPEELQGMFWANIGLIGGNTKLPGFRERLMIELRSLAPVDYDIEIYQSPDPITEAYHSALSFAQSPEFLRRHVVTREEYLEIGSNACRRRWKGPHGTITAKDVSKGKVRQRESDDEMLSKKIGKVRGRGGLTRKK